MTSTFVSTSTAMSSTHNDFDITTSTVAAPTNDTTVTFPTLNSLTQTAVLTKNPQTDHLPISSPSQQLHMLFNFNPRISKIHLKIYSENGKSPNFQISSPGKLQSITSTSLNNRNQIKLIHAISSLSCFPQVPERSEGTRYLLKFYCCDLKSYPFFMIKGSKKS